MWIETQYKKDKEENFILDENGEKIITGYKFVDRYFRPKVNGMRRKSTTLNSKSAQAQNKARQIINKKIDDQLEKDKQSRQYTLNEIYPLFFEYKKPFWEPATEENMLSSYRTHIEGHELLTYVIGQIKASDIQTLINEVQYTKKRSVSTTKRVKHLIVSAIRFAKKEYDNDYNIDFKDAKIKKPVKKLKEEFINSVDIPKFLERIRKIMIEFEADVLEAQILTGMRFGEMTALTKDDWDGKMIKINKSVDARNKRKIKDPKTYNSTRIIQSNDRINEIFSKRIAKNDILFKDKSKLIFANNNNRPPLMDPINKKLKKINKDYTTHTMRHTHVSLLAEKKLPLKYIMDRVGHADSQVTYQIYMHVTQRMKDEGSEALKDLY